MAFPSAHPGVISLLLMLSALLGTSFGKRSGRYALPGNYCGSRTKEIDGAVILSSNSRLYENNVCILKFITDDDSIFNKERFMIIFREFHITDCSVSLSLYFDRSSYGPADLQYDCNTRPPPRVLYTTGSRLTMRLEKTTRDGYNFNIVLTKITSDSSYCSDFRCRNSSHCIDDDLRCDSVENCLDGSDEINCRYHRTIIATGMGSIMGISMSSLLCCVIASVVALFCCRRRRSQQARAMTVVHTTKPLDSSVTHQAPPPYDAYQPVPSYGQNYPVQGVPQSYAMTQFYPPPPGGSPMYPPPPGASYPPPPVGAAAIPQYV